MDDLAKEVHSMKKDLQEKRAANSGDVSTKVAMQLRNLIKKQDVSQPWPPDTEQNVIPTSLREFLYTLLTGGCKCPNPSEKAQRFATPFGSDLVFAVTRDQAKPPKHLLLIFFCEVFDGEHRTGVNSESPRPLCLILNG